MEFNHRGFLHSTTRGRAPLAAARSPMNTPSSTASPPDVTDGLPFGPDAFIENIATDVGDRTVTYRFDGPIAYVRQPVNADYQSLVISVPTSTDGVAVDATPKRRSSSPTRSAAARRRCNRVICGRCTGYAGALLRLDFVRQMFGLSVT